MDWQALLLTLRLAVVTTAILLLVSIPLAAWIAGGRSLPRAAAEALATLPLLLPPTVLGFYLILLLGPRTGAGRLLIRMVGHPLAFTFAGLVLGSLLYSLPFAVQPLVAGFRAVDREVLEAGAMLGAGPVRILLRLLLPLSRPAILAAALLSFLHTVGEFGVVLMLGGNIPGETRTVSIALYDQVESFDYAGAHRTAILLVAVCFAALLLVGRVRRPAAGERP